MPGKGDAPVLPGARAVARHVRISPMKARRVVNLVRGLPAKEALTVLQFAPQAASEQVYKVLASAIANAENNERLDPDSLLVRAAYVDEGATLKRFRPRAQGRAYRITATGAGSLQRLGIAMSCRREPTPARRCLDWTERRSHIAGPLGIALADLALERVWVRRLPGTRPPCCRRR